MGPERVPRPSFDAIVSDGDQDLEMGPEVATAEDEEVVAALAGELVVVVARAVPIGNDPV
jgi:hypothetical protein